MRIYYFIRKFTFTSFFWNLLLIHYLFREFTLNALLCWRIYHILVFKTSLRVRRLGASYALTSGIEKMSHSRLSSITAAPVNIPFTTYMEKKDLNPLSFSRIYYKFSILFEVTLSSLSFSRIHYAFMLFFVNILTFRQFTMNSLSFSRTYFESTFLRIYYEYTIYSQICCEFTIYFAIIL